MRSRPSASQRESLAGNVPPKHLFRAIVHRIVPCILLFASILFLADCGGSSTGALPAGEWISISPQPASVPVNGTVTFTATTFEPDSTVTWSVLDDECGGVAGTLSSTTGNTVAYTAPATPPIYNPPCSGGKGNGQVTVEATYAGDLYNTVYFPITAPTVTVGLSPLTATVALGGTEQFVGYAVGNVNNGLTWQVNGVTGGSAATGTITNVVTVYYAGGLYTAPTVMPMTGDTVTITMISQADPTKTMTAIVTLQ